MTSVQNASGDAVADRHRAPDRVRVYFRNGHWLLQRREARARKDVTDRADRNLIDAVAKAQKIERHSSSSKVLAGSPVKAVTTFWLKHSAFALYLSADEYRPHLLD